MCIKHVYGLRTERIKAGLSQKLASQRLGISHSRLSKVEIGMLAPRRDELDAMTELYQSTYLRLLTIKRKKISD